MRDGMAAALGPAMAAGAAYAGCAAAAAAATWRVRDMPATPTPVNVLMLAMIVSTLLSQVTDCAVSRLEPNSACAQAIF